MAYTSFSKNPIIVYWEFLVPLTGILCVGTGWRHAHDKEARLRLIWTQALHWLAFLVVDESPARSGSDVLVEWKQQAEGGMLKSYLV
jgi:hypothetical protein